MATSQVGQLARRMIDAPPVAALRRRRHAKAFQRADSKHTFHGVYGSFAEAAAATPGTRPLGYDHEGAARMYVDRPTYPEDYAVYFWLGEVARPGMRLFDYGGHTGGFQQAYRRLKARPDGILWTIYDVPAVVEEGRRRFEGQEEALAFTTDFADASGADILLASGSLQYVEIPFAERLGRLSSLPRHLLVNQLPLHDALEFVTLQNIRTAYCPYWIQRRDRFLGSLAGLGYELVDTWSNPSKECFIPTYRRESVRGYTGAYLRLA